MPIVVRIDVELARRKMSVGEFADRVGLTPANVAVLKNGRAKAVRFSTLEAMCRVLDCQPGDLLEWVDERDHHDAPAPRTDHTDHVGPLTARSGGGPGLREETP
jgi:putative transcriptional regulator